MTNTAVRQAIEKVDAACPCRSAHPCAGGKGWICKCWKRHADNMTSSSVPLDAEPCRWPGHRLVRELSKVLGGAVAVLDVACFTGDTFGRLTDQDGVQGKFRYTGVDVTPKYVARAAQRWQGHANAEFIQGSAMGLAFDDSSFDLVFNSGMLIHAAGVAVFHRAVERRV